MTQESNASEKPVPRIHAGWTACGIALFVVLIALIVFRTDLYNVSINPRIPYQTYTPPPEPDYRSAEAWAATPSRPGNASMTPPGIERPANDPGVDVFFVHPTTYASRKGWNGPIDDPAARQLVNQHVLAYHASAFNGAGRLYVPRYRQATHYAFITRNSDAQEARRLAYGDVARAFSAFLDQRGDATRPFILAGQGQGAFHLIRLITERVVNTTLEHSLVAAYVLDTPLPADQQLGLPVCDEPEQTGCVVAFAFYATKGAAQRAGHRGMTWDGSALVSTEGRPTVCVDPFPVRGAGDVGKGLGALMGAQGVVGPGLGEPMEGAVRARCIDGALVAEEIRPVGLARSPLPLKPDHLGSIRLLYMDLRTDAIRRAAAFERHTPADTE